MGEKAMTEKNVFWILGLSMIFAGCGKGNGTNESNLFPHSNNDPAFSQNEVVPYARLRDEVLQPKGCIGCHGSMATEAGLLLDVVPGKFADSALYVSVANGSMPKGGLRLSEYQLNLVRAYIVGLVKVSEPPVGPNQPNPEPTPLPTTLPTPLPLPPDPLINYAQLSRDVLQPKGCLTCHDDLETESGAAIWVKAGDYENSKLYQSVVTGRMPKRGVRLNAWELSWVRGYILSLAANPEPSPSPTPSPEPTATPSPSPSPEPTATPSPSPSPTPSPVPEPTPNPSPTPSPAPSPSPNPLPEGVGFEELKAKFLQPYCLTCHTRWENPDRFKRTYKPGKPEESSVWRWVESGEMPPKDDPTLPRPTSEEIELLRQFILQQTPVP